MTEEVERATWAPVIYFVVVRDPAFIEEMIEQTDPAP